MLSEHSNTHSFTTVFSVFFKLLLYSQRTTTRFLTLVSTRQGIAFDSSRGLKRRGFYSSFDPDVTFTASQVVYPHLVRLEDIGIPFSENVQQWPWPFTPSEFLLFQIRDNWAMRNIPARGTDLVFSLSPFASNFSTKGWVIRTWVSRWGEAPRVNILWETLWQNLRKKLWSVNLVSTR